MLHDAAIRRNIFADLLNIHKSTELLNTHKDFNSSHNTSGKQ